MAGDRTTFHIDIEEKDGRCFVQLAGVVDENADLSAFAALSAPLVEVDLREVRRINSFGVRSWMEAIRKIPDTTRVEFFRCPPPIIDQCNMVAGFLGHSIPKSFYAMMVCEDCDRELDHLFETARCMELGGRLPPVPCPSCGEDMEIDDLEEQYLSFMRDPA